MLKCAIKQFKFIPSHSNSSDNRVSNPYCQYQVFVFLDSNRVALRLFTDSYTKARCVLNELKNMNLTDLRYSDFNVYSYRQLVKLNK